MSSKNFDSFMVDIISIVKKDGTTINDVKASVEKNKIFINDVKTPIEDGDIAIRLLPSGIVEEYTIIDKGFMKSMGSFPDNYQMTVKKKHNIVADKNNETYNFTANNDAKLFIHSNDNSININMGSSIFEDLIEKLNEIDETSMSTDLKNELIKDINDLEKFKDDKNKFGPKFTDFVGKTGAIINVIAPYIDLLTKFL